MESLSASIQMNIESKWLALIVIVFIVCLTGAELGKEYLKTHDPKLAEKVVALESRVLALENLSRQGK